MDHWWTSSENYKKDILFIIQGSTPSQIAKKFTEEGIMNPTEYHQSLGMKTQNPISEVKTLLVSNNSN